MANINFKLISNNVRGLNESKKRNKYYNWLKINNVDIACLQETFLTVKSEQEIKHTWDGQLYHNYSDSPHSKGVCIIFKKDFDCNVLSIHRQLNGRTLLINTCIGKRNITICNIYAPNKNEERVTFFLNILQFIKKHKIADSILILCGDMNTQLYNNTLKREENVSSHIRHILNEQQLIDCSRALNDNKQSTYIKPGNLNIQSQIDYIFVSKFFKSHIKYKLRVAPSPDHKALEIDIKEIRKQKRTLNLEIKYGFSQ